MQIRTPEVELAEKMQDFLYALNLKLIEMAAANKTITFSVIKKAINKSYVDNPDANTKKSKPKKSNLPPITSLTDPEKEIPLHFEEVAKLIPPGLEIDVKGNNNLNLIITDPRTSTNIVIQFSKKRNMPYVVSDKKAVSASLEGKHIDEVLAFHSSAMSKDYTKPLYIPINAVEPPKKLHNNDNNEKIISIRSTEFLPTSIGKAIKDLSPNERLALAINIAKQTSALLTMLYQNNIVWTDLKEGNVLLRDKNIVITDTKGFIFSDKIDLAFIEKSNSFRGQFEATGSLCSTSYDRFSLVSADAALKGLTPEERKLKVPEVANDARKIMAAEWQKEHNYQMAVLIYFVLTGKNVYNENERLKETDVDYNYFKFDTKEFDFGSPAGKEIRKVIEALSNKEPDLRMSHQDAVASFKKSPELEAVLKGDMLRRAETLKREASIRQENLENAAHRAATRQSVLPRAVVTKEPAPAAAPAAPKKKTLLRTISQSAIKSKDAIKPKDHVSHHDTTIIHDPNQIHAAPVKPNNDKPKNSDKPDGSTPTPGHRKD